LASRTRLDKYTLTVGRFRIPVAVVGAGARCIVCVNGMQQTMATWRSFLHAFGRDPRYRVALFDFPTQGRAAIVSGPPETSLDEQVAVLDAVTSRVSPAEPIGLIGGSWGGVLSAALAAAKPAHVGALVLGSFRTSPNAWLREITERGQALVDRGDGDGLGALFVKAFGERMRPAGQQRMRDQFRRLTMEQLRQLHYSGELLLAHTDLAAVIDLTRISARTLIVNGGADPIVDTDNATAAALRIPRCEVRILPGVGHFLHIEEPEIMQIYREFFDRWAAG